MNTELRPIYSCIADGLGAERCFLDLIRFALTYKYPPPLVVPLNDKELTEILFGFSATDQISVWDGQVITGQDFEELLITSIFLEVVEKMQKGKSLWLALPPEGKQESYDTVIVGCDPKEVKITQRKLRLPNSESGFSLRIQVKRDYQYDDGSSQIIVPEPLDLGRLHKWSETYSEFVLVFMQTFGLFSSEDAEDVLRNGHTGIIHVFNEDVTLYDHETDELNGTIKPKNNAFNFLVSLGDKVHHVFFRFPPFLIRETGTRLIERFLKE